MRTDFYYDSCGVGKIHACVWTPEQSAKAVVQIIHGIAEYAERYDRLANYLNEHGYLVVAEDHMGHGKSIGKDGVPNSRKWLEIPQSYIKTNHSGKIELVVPDVAIPVMPAAAGRGPHHPPRRC